MTRLSEAFQRARATGSERDPAVTSLEGSGDALATVPGTWRFDTEEIAPSQEPAEAPDVEALEPEPEPDPEQFEYPFAKAPAVAAKLVIGASPNHALVEEFRHLAASLHHAQLRTGARTVMIASAVEGEGKTTTAVNLALTLSHSHRRRVLLVDADLRRPSIHALFQLSNREGLSEALKVVTPETPLPLHRISPTLSVLTAGFPTADPMSTLVSDMMREFMREASQQFDWVIIDTPPVALLSDANLLAAMIDIAVIVVSANTTPYPLVRRAVEAIGPAKILGCVLNRTNRPAVALGYRYAYAYRYAPGIDKRPKKAWAFPFGRKR